MAASAESQCCIVIVNCTDSKKVRHCFKWNNIVKVLVLLMWLSHFDEVL